VTNAEYRLFVEATARRAPSHWPGGTIPEGRELHPVTYVSWPDAAAFCRWAGGFLPSEAQWERAARGHDRRVWPWGDESPTPERATFAGKHYQITNAPNYPKPLQPRIPIWIGGRGEKRTLRAAAKFADGWNGAYIGPVDWKHKSEVLDRWCETEGRDPRTIMRTVNLGFYLGVDARGAARAEEVFRSHFGTGDRADRTGYLRGTVRDAHKMVDEFRTLGCTRLSIAFRNGPYDWDALEAFAAEIVRAR
jgi:alkanesulfonate monooxygenase SsuD/methylene tetrahydromethanopterin reductase-like flavin-dependent oxidoreductase (luciferase family)